MDLSRLPWHVLARIVAAAPWPMLGLGSASAAWRRLVAAHQRRVRARGHAVRACLALFPRATELRVRGDAPGLRAALGARELARLVLDDHGALRDCDLAGLRVDALDVVSCRRLRSVAALPELRWLRVAFSSFVPETLAASTRLVELHLSTNYLKPRGVATLARTLAAMPQLTALTVHNNTAAPLVAALAALTRLTSLDLSANYLAAAGATALAPALAALTGLTTLDLGGNLVGPAGATALAPALRGLTGLTSLRLAYNHVQGAGLRALAPGLRGLRALDIGLNDLKGLAARAAAALPPVRGMWCA
jgi:hypothetical protein